MQLSVVSIPLRRCALIEEIARDEESIPNAADPSATRVRFMHSTLGVITALTACLLLLVTAAYAFSALEPADWLLGVIGAG